jgi:hypothetical protein
LGEFVYRSLILGEDRVEEKGVIVYVVGCPEQFDEGPGLDWGPLCGGSEEVEFEDFGGGLVDYVAERV